MWTELRDRDFTATDISTKARTETLDTYQDAIPEFETNNWTYLPIPTADKYYNIKTEEPPQDIDSDQYIDPDSHFLDVMEMLVEHPFLLVENNDTYEIIHLSNLNKREVKDFLYPLFSELSEELAHRIEDYYENSEDMLGMVNEFTLGTWYKARQEDVDLHIAEFLTLSNMIGIIKGHEPIMKKCGFEGNNEVDELGGVENLRNRVMHGNRTLVTDRDMLESHIERIERAENIVKRLT